MSGIYWLASYPKSGNTWLRAFLTNYQSNSDVPADINELDGGWIASLREPFDDLLGIESFALTLNQIDRYRPLVYELMASESIQPQFIKIHDAFTRNSDNQPIFSKQATAGVIYLVRNPLDVAVSYAHHRDESVDETIRFMGNNDAIMARQVSEQLPQRLLSWSGHVASWIDEPELNLHVVRYEEMIEQPLETFSDIVNFIGLEFNPERLRKAIEFSSFELLQAQESQHGFAEKQPTAKSFFRKGRTDSWRESLTEQQVRQLIADHGEVMRRFGYLSSSHEAYFESENSALKQPAFI